MGLKFLDVLLNTRLPAVSPFHALTNAKSPLMASSMMYLQQRHVTHTTHPLAQCRAHALAAAEHACLARLGVDCDAAVGVVFDGEAPLLDDGASASGSEKGGNAGAAGAQALGEGAWGEGEEVVSV